MNWNHRVVRVVQPYPQGDEIQLVLAEVFYDEQGNPTGWTEPFMWCETRKGLKQLLKRLKKALDHPVLEDADFPKKP